MAIIKLQEAENDIKMLHLALPPPAFTLWRTNVYFSSNLQTFMKIFKKLSELIRIFIEIQKKGGLLGSISQGKYLG